MSLIGEDGGERVSEDRGCFFEGNAMTLGVGLRFDLVPLELKAHRVWSSATRDSTPPGGDPSRPIGGPIASYRGPPPKQAPRAGWYAHARVGRFDDPRPGTGHARFGPSGSGDGFWPCDRQGHADVGLPPGQEPE